MILTVFSNSNSFQRWPLHAFPSSVNRTIKTAKEGVDDHKFWCRLLRWFCINMSLDFPLLVVKFYCWLLMRESQSEVITEIERETSRELTSARDTSHWILFCLNNSTHTQHFIWDLLFLQHCKSGGIELTLEANA